MEVARAMRYSGLGVRSVDPVGDFLEPTCHRVKCQGFPMDTQQYGETAILKRESPPPKKPYNGTGKPPYFE